MAATLDVDERRFDVAIADARPRARHANAGDAHARRGAAGASDAANGKPAQRSLLGFHVS
ncbi:hypothetical protein WT83_26065 [Burkholderia territorii]|uniref:Uncharacterized protein n=1 Tax=Burkholderia territorii TaxID=1503055 RepID=A0A108E8L7_9BURK|nr:hypothetical protein WT83_26065 [Burkholderia territorii]